MKNRVPKGAQKTFGIWVLLLIVVVFFVQQMSMKKDEMMKEFSYPDFITALENKQIEEITFYTKAQEIEGVVKKEFADEFKTKFGGTMFKIPGNIDNSGYQTVKENGIVPKYNNEDRSLMVSILLNMLPLLLILGLFIFFMRQLQSGGGKAFNFGKSKAKLLNEFKKKVTFKDVAGVDEAKEELSEIVEFLKEPKRFTKLGGRIPKGVLLVGPPGTGKTLLARAVAGEAGVPFFSISGSDFVEMFVGVGASRVRDMFEQGRRNAPCIIFIDEIDAVGRHRGAGMGGGHDEREQTLNQLLVEMDGFEGTEGVIIIAATNRADVLDPALLRPGRLDRRVMVGKPDLNGRIHILKVHMKKVPLAKEVVTETIARGTPGFSGADLANLVNEAALIAARTRKKMIDMDDFEEARDKILMGAERKSMRMTEEDKLITAYHEAGHTIVNKSLKGLDPIHKVSIIPRGMALGVTQTLPEKDHISFTKSKAENMIAFLFGGRAAEEIVFKDITSGASNDIERATEIARKMVTEWGMSTAIGPMNYASSDSPVFVGMQSNPGNEISDSKAQQIDDEVHRIIQEGYIKAVKILTEKKEALESLTKGLIEFETVDGVEVDMLMTGATPEEIKTKRIERNSKIKTESDSIVEISTDNKEKNNNDGPDGLGDPNPMGSPA